VYVLCIGLMASLIHHVTELTVRQLSLASVMTLIANCSQSLIWRTISCHFTADITTLCVFTDHTDR